MKARISQTPQPIQPGYTTQVRLTGPSAPPPTRHTSPVQNPDRFTTPTSFRLPDPIFTGLEKKERYEIARESPLAWRYGHTSFEQDEK